VLDALGPDPRAIATAALLAGLPGLLVVRSPWRAMPALSLTFWVLSWTWTGDGPRLRTLHVALLAFITLAALRVMRPGPLPRPRPAHLVLALAAVLLAAPYLALAVPAGARMPLETVTAELLAWRDGWPRSFEPLLPVQPFRASGLATLGGDVVLLSGSAAHRALLAAAALGDLVLLLALWSLAEVGTTRGRATVVAATAALATLDPAGTGPSALATALAVQAVALWLDRRGRPSAFAAGALVAAALATDPPSGLAALVLGGLGARLGLLRADRADAFPRERRRLALLTALVLAVPVALRPPPLEWPSPAPLLALGLTLGLGRLASVAARPRLSPAFVAAIGALLLAGAGVRALPRAAASRDEAGPDPDGLAALFWIRGHTRPLDLVCAPKMEAARWIPALAARPSDVPVRDGWPAAAGPCRAWISFGGRVGEGFPTGPSAYASAGARVWTTSQMR
jgi:hypothetical protein